MSLHHALDVEPVSEKALYVHELILSRLVDTFISKISLTIILPAFYHGRKPAVGRADPPVIPVAEEVSPNERF